MAASPPGQHDTTSPFAARLLSWYEGSGRDLPWRRDRDPYRIWVSEVMLQQTRAETVVPYYERFLKRFPDLRALARADLEEVLALWSGLGYYGRARRMHRAARQVVAAGGELPRTAAELRALPGIGPYTAAAVASIAFGEKVPVLDGNVVRVLSRFLAEGGDPGRAAVRRRLLAAAGHMLEAERPGDGNQALMELGATLCRPRAPRCGRCPLEVGCAAAAAGEPEAFPRRARKRPTVRERRLAVVVERDGKVLFFRRPDDSELLAGTWELPWVAWAEDDGASSSLAQRYGGRWRLGASHGWVRHGITYRSLEVEVRAAELAAAGVAEGPEAGWLDPFDLEGKPVSSLVGKLLALRRRPPAKTPRGTRARKDKDLPRHPTW